MVLNMASSHAAPIRGLYTAVCCTILMGLPISSNAQSVLLGDSAKGKALHDKNCVACHAGQYKDPSKIYTRPDRRVNSVEGLMKQVAFCNKQTGANLSDDEVNDIIKYLNDTFYKFE